MTGWREALFEGRPRFTEVERVWDEDTGTLCAAFDRARGDRVLIKTRPAFLETPPEFLQGEIDPLRRLDHPGFLRL